MEYKGEWDDDSFEGLQEMEGRSEKLRESSPSEDWMAHHPVMTSVTPRSALGTKITIVFLDLFYILAPDPFKYNFS